jgi:hypothetical protein
MVTKNRPMDPVLEALVSERLEPNECVLDWSEVRPGEVNVRLIDRDMHRRHQESRIPRVRNGGYGRGLSFQRREGQWVLMGVAGWMT